MRLLHFHWDAGYLARLPAHECIEALRVGVPHAIHALGGLDPDHPLAMGRARDLEVSPDCERQRQTVAIGRVCTNAGEEDQYGC